VGLSSLNSGPLKERGDDGRSSRSPIKSSVELRRSAVSVTERNFEKRDIRAFYKGAIHLKRPVVRDSSLLGGTLATFTGNFVLFSQ